MERKQIKVCVAYYSPTATSQKIALAIAQGLGDTQIQEVNLTVDEATEPIVVDADWLVVAAPVYAGRVSVDALRRLKRLSLSQSADAKKIPVVVAVVYGNRDYDDALLELKNEVAAWGFLPVAAGAFIGEHSFSRKGMPVGEGRPDASDVQVAADFGAEAMRRWEASEGQGELSVRGNMPYMPHKELPPVAPQCTDDCTRCGKCISVCPVHAISRDENKNIVTDVALCTLCCACVKMCPSGGRVFDTPFTKMLFENFSARKEPELFYRG